MSQKKISGCKKYNSNEEVNYRMELGNKLEDFVANEFSLKTGLKVRNVNGILKNDKYPFAIANIDRAVVGEKAFLECKVTNSYSKKVWQMGVPIHYQIQVNHYMAVTGATHCYVAALIGNEELIIHRIDRDEEIIDEIMKLEAMFWDKCILGGEIPAPDEGFHASVSEHSPEGCVPQDGCRLCSRGCSQVPRAVVQSRVPAVPQGLCAGAGTLPPARLSTQPARGAAQGAAGRRVGGRSPPAGQGRGLLLPQLLPGAGGSQLHCTPECFQEHFARGETRQGFFVSCS